MLVRRNVFCLNNLILIIYEKRLILEARMNMKNQKQRKQHKKIQIIMIAGLVISVLGVILSTFGLSKTIADLDGEVISHTPEAILASAGVTDGVDVDLPVTYFDQRADECVNMYEEEGKDALERRQFEWFSCGYTYKELESGLVKYELGEDYLPVAVGGELLSNRGMVDMKRWFNSVENKSKEYAGFLNLSYSTDNGTRFSFNNEEFYPLDEAEFSKSDEVNKDGHNHLFTMSFAVPFTVVADGGEGFEIVADDDTFVFVGNELAIDMGGIHNATNGRLMINEAGEVYTAVAEQDYGFSGIKLEKGQGAVLRVFHADRDAVNSVMKINISGMKLDILNTQVASGGSDGAQIAQVSVDPSDPTYVAPLGESLTSTPDGTRGYMVMATALGMAIVLSAMVIVMMAHSLIRIKVKK